MPPSRRGARCWPSAGLRGGQALVIALSLDCGWQLAIAGVQRTGAAYRASSCPKSSAWFASPSSQSVSVKKARNGVHSATEDAVRACLEILIHRGTPRSDDPIRTVEIYGLGPWVRGSATRHHRDNSSGVRKQRHRASRREVSAQARESPPVLRFVTLNTEP